MPINLRTLQPVAKPKDHIMCLALVRPGSRIEREWKPGKAAYCIYEYEPAFDRHQIRWGDGSWQDLTPEDFPSLVLMKEFGSEELDQLFNGYNLDDAEADQKVSK